ncbi:MAG: SAM-dependent methyltransferase [Aquificaceae bacterium]|nr:SAM-dependent methyltransferase [Aquificaceae bacterium]MCX8060927.1 SAM-dependent methyltransferase [Aquificaceae bacterium]MDW8096674.1 SAM-dependent methyltransferase [Aquificaceae bacterium]
MISFRDWMAQNVKKYYRSDFRKDFFTAPELDRAFGYALAHHLAELVEGYERPALLELGGGSGALAYDVLSYLRKHRADLYSRLVYYILDFSPKLVELQRRRLGEFQGKVFWVESLVPVQGVVFSNEFFDCLPVHVLREGKELFLENGKQVWREFSTPRLGEVLRRMGYEGLSQTVELCLDCIDFLQRVAEHLLKGYHLVVDYGYKAQEIKRFPEGTVVGYRLHRLHTKVQEGMDLTAHVNFSLLEEYGRDFGLETLSLKSLRDFLLSAPPFVEELELLSRSETPEGVERLSRLKTMLVSMGDRFKVLLQRKLQDS